MHKLVRTAAAAALATSFGVAATAASAAGWDMPTPYPEGNFHTQNIIQFAKDVDAATGGKLTIKVHSAGSLIKHAEIKNAVRGGQVPIGEFLLARLSNENPVFQADAIPFLANSYDAAAKLWKASRAQVEELLAGQRLKVLFSVPWPPQGIYTRKALNSIDDMKGLKFRTYNSTTERLAELAGAVPTQIEVPDVPQAFATGLVEAMITSASTGVNTKAWDFLDHFYDTQAFLPKNIVVVNIKAFDALDAATQQAVMKAAAAAEKRGWAASAAGHAKQTKTLAEHGVKVEAPSAALAGALEKVGATMSAEWAAKAGDAGEAIMDAYRK